MIGAPLGRADAGSVEALPGSPESLHLMAVGGRGNAITSAPVQRPLRWRDQRNRTAGPVRGAGAGTPDRGGAVSAGSSGADAGQRGEQAAAA